MGLFDKEIDITRNIKVIEWLKSELLADVADLFRILVSGMKEEIHETLSESLANIIVICYILGRRLGLNYNAVEIKMKNKIRLGILQSHEIEKQYGDLTELSKHLDSSREKYKELQG